MRILSPFILMCFVSRAMCQEKPPSESVVTQPTTVVTITLSSALSTSLEKERVDLCDKLTDVNTKLTTCIPRYSSISDLLKAKLTRSARDIFRETLLKYPPASVTAAQSNAAPALKSIQAAQSAVVAIQ